jgi:MFS family permease
MHVPPRQSLPPGNPLRHEAFRAIWIAAIFSYIGTWVQDVGEGWLMMSLTRDPFPVAMLTTAMTVPMFTLLMPAGLMADRLDRRRILIVAQGSMAAVALALAICTALGWASPLALLVASAGLGVGSALSSPAWSSLVPELVPRKETSEAVTLNSVAFNIARAVGPALGGLILATRGPATAFFLNAVSFLAVIEVLRRYDELKKVSAASAGRRRKAEPLLRALLAAFTYVKRSGKLRAMHWSVSAFGLAAASVPALLPVLAKQVLHTDGGGYGLMLGALGTGAVGAALLLKRVRSMVSARSLVAGAMGLYGVSILAMSLTRSLPVAIALLLPAGMGWLASLATLNALVQLSVPSWIKSRVIALYNLCFYVAWSVGASVGGLVAGRIGVALTIGLAAGGTLAAAVFSARLQLPSYEGDTSHELLTTPAPVSVR